MILPMTSSPVARIIGVSHRCLAFSALFMSLQENKQTKNHVRSGNSERLACFYFMDMVVRFTS
jgi:hypothetical protein